jgi:hypothetical protein
MKEGTKVYRLDSIEAKPTKDVLSAKFLGHFRYEAMFGNGYKFQVNNETNEHEYKVKIFQNSVGDWVMSCDCPARTQCKHLNCAKELFEQMREGLEKV